MLRSIYMETNQPIMHSREELMELYKLIFDAYQKEVDRNWNRSQYFLVLNIGIVGTATGIVQLGKGDINLLVAGVYMTGFLCSIMSITALQMQRKYYIQLRQNKAHLEKELKLTEYGLKTITKSGNKIFHYLTFKSLINYMLGVIAVVDLLGAIFVISHAYK